MLWGISGALMNDDKISETNTFQKNIRTSSKLSIIRLDLLERYTMMQVLCSLIRMPCTNQPTNTLGSFSLRLGRSGCGSMG